MPTFTKALLKPKTYHSPDGELLVDDARLKRWADSHKRLSKAGLTVPMHFDHSDKPEDNRPLTKKELRSAKNTVGKLAGVKYLGDGEGVELTLEITDPKAAGRAERNEIFASPVIVAEFKDGAGQTHQDVFASVDMVDLPVDHAQGAFVPAAGTLACGIRLGLGTSIYRLGIDGDEDDESDDDPTDDDTDTEDDDSDGMLNKDGEEENKSGGQLKALVEKLVQEMDVHFPEGVDHESTEGMILLLTAVLNRNAGAANDDDSNEDEEDDMANKPTVPLQPDMAVMSLQAKTALDYAERQHRLSLTSQLDALCKVGKCTPAEVAKYKPIIGAVRLSLTTSGEPELSDVDKFIASREAVPEGTFWDDKSRLRMAAQPQALPGYATFNEDPDATEANAIAEWAGGKGKKPTAA